MKPTAGRVIGVLTLALAGLVLAVALGVVVARSASQSVALGGSDLGSQTHLVSAAETTTTTTPAVTVPPPTTTTATTAPATTTATTPQSTHDDGNDKDPEHEDGADNDD